MKRHMASVLLFLTACAGEAPPEPQPQHQQQPAETAPSAAATPEQPAVPTSAPSVQGPKLAFIDEGAKDSEFAAFRQRLLEAVRRRDRAAVLEVADPKIRTSFGTEGGRADLERKLQQDPKLWEQLESILALGGTFRTGGGTRMFWAPYIFSTFPEDRDAFTSFAVIADDVPLRERPSADARILANLSRDIVTGDPGDSEEWIEVQTVDGRKGWVEKKFVRSPIDYRAGFVRTDQGWRMNAFIAGD